MSTRLIGWAILSKLLGQANEALRPWKNCRIPVVNDEFVAIFHFEVCICLLDMEAFPSSSSINISRSVVVTSGLIETDKGKGLLFSCDKTVVDCLLTRSTKLGNTLSDKQLCMVAYLLVWVGIRLDDSIYEAHFVSHAWIRSGWSTNSIWEG